MKDITICLPIADRRRAMDFYTAAFDLDPVCEPGEDGIPEPLQFRLDPRTRMMLIPAGGFGWILGDRPAAPPHVSECLISITLDSEPDVDHVVSRVVEAGGRILGGPAREEWGYCALCADPDGHAWQVGSP